MNFTPEQVAAQCRVSGPAVGPLPAGIDGAQLLYALAGNESSFGVDCTPRHEPAYDVGGAYATHAPMPELLADFGSPAAACSYGPLQVMLCNCPQMTPTMFNNLAEAVAASVCYLNHQLRAFRPQTLAQIGSLWNSGGPNHLDNPAVARYAADLAKNYATPMPPQ